MIDMGTIIGRLHTPEDSNGERDVLHPETSVDAVLDPITGIPLPDRLATIENQLQVVDVENNKNGFMTPSDKKLLTSLGSGEIVISESKPDKTDGCLWVHIDASKTESS